VISLGRHGVQTILFLDSDLLLSVFRLILHNFALVLIDNNLHAIY